MYQKCICIKLTDITIERTEFFIAAYSNMIVPVTFVTAAKIDTCKKSLAFDLQAKDALYVNSKENDIRIM